MLVALVLPEPVSPPQPFQSSARLQIAEASFCLRFVWPLGTPLISQLFVQMMSLDGRRDDSTCGKSGEDEDWIS